MPDTSLLFPLLGLPVAYGIAGIVLGFGVTLSAWIVDTWLSGLRFSIQGVWAVHGENPLHIYLDLSPVVLGLIGYVIGATRGRASVIAKRAKAMANSRTRDSHWRRVVAASPDGVLIVDGKGVVLHVNPAAERVFGRRASHLSGMKVPELLQNSHRMTEDRAFDLKTGLGEHLGSGWKVLARHGSGALVPVMVTMSMLGSSAEAPVCYRVRDVSLEPKRTSTQPTPQRSIGEID